MDQYDGMGTDRAPNGSGWVGSTALPDPKLRVGSGNGSERVRRVLNLTNQ